LAFESEPEIQASQTDPALLANLNEAMEGPLLAVEWVAIHLAA